MRAVIFTEDSSTTANSRELSLLEYYKGGFLSAKPVYTELSDVCDPDMYVASEKFGVADVKSEAQQVLDGGSQVSHKELVDIITEKVLTEVLNAEIIVLLFSSTIFESAVMSDWDKIVDRAEEESIWCICAPQSLLSIVDLSELEEKCQLITYERVGVSRITTSTRDELINLVESVNRR